MTENFVDQARSADLSDVGLAGYLLATIVAEDGSEHAILAEHQSIGDETVLYDPQCAEATHEQRGALPVEFVRRIAISRRTQRCGRPTKAGPPCRCSVTHPGDACAHHSEQTSASHREPKGTAP
jgi:hypothetical protein